MSSLTEQLKKLGVQVGTSKIKTPSTKQAQLQSLVDILPGAWESTNRGDCFVVRKDFPLGSLHGRKKIRGIADMNFFESIDLLSGISDVPLEDYLFIDTETTGLSGGVGTYVFLVGVAKYSKDALHLAQFFLEEPASESSQLAALESFASTSKVIVSYNGKSFDLPRIKTRYDLHGWPDPFEGIYHIDLLHIARRLWKSHLPGCSLGDLEHHLLDLQRDGLDIPGWKVSEHFFEYLRSGDPAPLKNVFYHNEVDVISLAALLEYISDRLSSPLKKKYIKEHDLVSIGRYFLSLSLLDNSTKVLSTALSITDLPEWLALEGKLSLALAYKRSGDLDQAVPIWIDCSGSGAVEPLIELAKYAEHKQSDYDDAIHWTLSALDAIKELPDGKQTRLEEELQFRMNRLKKKAKR